MLRIAVFALVLAASSFGARAAVSVGTCEEFAAVDRKTETEVTITNADFACAEYTRLSVRSAMVLKSSVGAITFSNLALKVYGSLTVEPDIEFTGITDVDKNGGALKLELDAVGIFQGTVTFTDVSIMPADLGTDDAKFRKGGCIHSKGDLTFEKDVIISGCRNNQVDRLDESSGDGGAIYHHVKGKMYFMGTLTMTENETTVYFDRGNGEGGGIYNRGDIVVDGEATFTSNKGNEGGGIFQERWATFEFNSFATFSDNWAWNQQGGAIHNFGGDVTFNEGSLFDDNVASSTGDGGSGGAIYNKDGGVVTLTGQTSFTNNWAYIGGAIYNAAGDRFFSEDSEYQMPILDYPVDTVFEGNVAEFCPDIYFDTSDNCGP